MKATAAVRKVTEGAYFVVDPTGYTGQISAFDLAVATQTITSAPSPSGEWSGLPLASEGDVADPESGAAPTLAADSPTGK